MVVDCGGVYEIDACFTTEIDFPTSENHFAITIFPNPAVDFFTISFKEIVPNAPINVFVSNTMGQMIAHQKNFGQKEIKVELNHFTPGLYLIEVVGEGFRQGMTHPLQNLGGTLESRLVPGN